MQENLAQSSIDLRGVYLVLQRRVQLLALGALVGVLLALAPLAFISPQYTASATLMVDNREERILNDSLVAPLRANGGAIASEAAVIVSPEVLTQVASRLDLAKDPDFQPTSPHVLGAARAQLFSLFGRRPNEVGAGEKNNDSAEIVEALRKAIEVTPVPSTNLLQVSVTLRDPVKAARIANTVVDSYFIRQLNWRYDVTRRATDWLKERLAEHKDRLRLSEGRFEQFKGQMEMLEKEGATLEERQLAKMNEELVTARIRTADAYAKYVGVQHHADGSNIRDDEVAELAQSSLILALRNQLAVLTREEGGLLARFGKQHPMVIRVRAEKQGITAQIEGEVRRVVAILKNDYEVSKSREMALKNTITVFATKNSSLRPEYAQLKELQREAESDRALYEFMLNRMKQVDGPEIWKSPDFRVVAAAVPPRTSNKSKSNALMLAGLMIGLGFGVSLTIVAELLDNTLKRGRDVEVKLGVPHLVNVPLLPASPSRPGTDIDPMHPPGPNDSHLATLATTQQAGSPFSDAMLALFDSLRSAASDAPIKSVMFTSATTGEGKSVVAANFAQAAAQSGYKVLLICTDLRTPTPNFFEPADQSKADLVDYLNGTAEIEKTIARHGNQVLFDVVPAARSASNAAWLLASPRMDKLLEWAKANYDLVVLDTVSIGNSLDGRMLARRVDATILVVEWLKTRVEVAKEAVGLLLKNDARIAGAVLNKVDFSKAKLYGTNSS